MTITDKEINDMIDATRFVLDAIARYDSRYIGNVPEKEARKMFPEMFNDN